MVPEMALPRQEEFIRPALEIASRNDTAITSKKIVAGLSEVLSLTDADLAEKTGSGASRVEKHTAWAVYLLRKAGLMESVSRGKYRITPAGRRYLADHPESVSHGELLLMPTEAHRQISESDSSGHPETATSPSGRNAMSGDPRLERGANPEDQIAANYELLQAQLADDLLESVKSISPGRFEDLVIDLLVKLGYGDGQRVGRSGDGGIDGIVTQDPLGFEKVYVQAKRWADAPVGGREIREFSGSLDPHGASKGVFITTSRFSDSARQTAADAGRNGKTIRLIDGPELVNLMIERDVGVVSNTTYRIKSLDENYFAAE